MKKRVKISVLVLLSTLGCVAFAGTSSSPFSLTLSEPMAASQFTLSNLQTTGGFLPGLLKAAGNQLTTEGQPVNFSITHTTAQADVNINGIEVGSILAVPNSTNTALNLAFTPIANNKYSCSYDGTPSEPTQYNYEANISCSISQVPWIPVEQFVSYKYIFKVSGISVSAGRYQPQTAEITSKNLNRAINFSFSGEYGAYQANFTELSSEFPTSAPELHVSVDAPIQSGEGSQYSASIPFVVSESAGVPVVNSTSFKVYEPYHNAYEQCSIPQTAAVKDGNTYTFNIVPSC